MNNIRVHHTRIPDSEDPDPTSNQDQPDVDATASISIRHRIRVPTIWCYQLTEKRGLTTLHINSENML